MPVHKFLALLGPLVAREPAVFFEAVMAACTLREGAGGAAPQVVLRKPKARRACCSVVPYPTLCYPTLTGTCSAVATACHTCGGRAVRSAARLQWALHAQPGRRRAPSASASSLACAVLACAAHSAGVPAHLDAIFEHLVKCKPSLGCCGASVIDGHGVGSSGGQSRPPARQQARGRALQCRHSAAATQPQHRQRRRGRGGRRRRRCERRAPPRERRERGAQRERRRSRLRPGRRERHARRQRRWSGRRGFPAAQQPWRRRRQRRQWRRRRRRRGRRRR